MLAFVEQSNPFSALTEIKFDVSVLSLESNIRYNLNMLWTKMDNVRKEKCLLLTFYSVYFMRSVEICQSSFDVCVLTIGWTCPQMQLITEWLQYCSIHFVPVTFASFWIESFFIQ